MPMRLFLPSLFTLGAWGTAGAGRGGSAECLSPCRSAPWSLSPALPSLPGDAHFPAQLQLDLSEVGVAGRDLPERPPPPHPFPALAGGSVV